MHTPPIARFGPHKMAGWVVRPRRRLRAGVTQLLCIAAGVALGLTLPRIDGDPQVQSIRAIEVLGFVGITVAGVTGVIFSLLFLVAQWASGNFTPRLTLFRTDPMVWRTFAFIIGLLAYTIATTMAIGGRQKVTIAVPVVTGVLAVAAIAVVRNLLLRALQSIQLAHVLAVTAERAYKVADAFFPIAGRPAEPGPAFVAAPIPLPPARATVTWPDRTTTVQQLDIRRLANAARKSDSVVVLSIPVGATIQHGDAVAEVRGGELTAGEVLAAIIVGRERTFHQDLEFAFRLLADIGLRALSPAVNDPATAVQVLDALDGLLRRLIAAPLDAVSVTDERDTVRVVLHLPTWTDFLRVSLDDLCSAASASPMVLLRVRTLLKGLQTAAPDSERRSPVAARLAWVEHELAERYPLFLREAGAEQA